MKCPIKGLCGLLTDGKEKSRNKFLSGKKTKFCLIFSDLLFKVCLHNFLCLILPYFQMWDFQRFYSALYFSWLIFIFSFCLILLSVFLSPIPTSHTSFALSSVTAHYLHFNLSYIPPLFPLSLFIVAITVSMIFCLMC